MDRLGHLLRRSAPRRRLTGIAERFFTRRRVLLGAATASLVPALASCSAATGPSPTASGFDTGELSATLASGDRTRFLALFTPDAAGQDLGARLFANWTALGARLSGADAAQGARLVVRWSAPGERNEAVETVAPTVVSGLVRSATPAGGTSPLWLVEEVAIASAHGAACVRSIAVPDAVGAAWLTAAAEASGVVTGAGLGSAAASWDGVLVVVLPSTPDAFRRVSGLDSATAAATQAAAVMAASDSAPRIVGNTATTSGLDAAGLRTVLVHEGVHVALRSAVSNAPLWASEGIAESVAEASDPGTRERNAALVAAAPRPSALPSAADLAGPDAPTAYALASVAVDAAIARWGRPAVLSWLADWAVPTRPSDAELTAAYLAALPG